MPEPMFREVGRRRLVSAATVMVMVPEGAHHDLMTSDSFPKLWVQRHVLPCLLGWFGTKMFILFSFENKLYIIDLPLKNVCAKFLFLSQRV